MDHLKKEMNILDSKAGVLETSKFFTTKTFKYQV